MAADKWDLAEDVGDYTQTLDKPMGGSETGSAVTTEEQTFMMLPQTLPDGAMVEVVFADNVTGKERHALRPHRRDGVAARNDRDLQDFHHAGI